MNIKTEAGSITQTSADTIVAFLLQDNTDFGGATESINTALNGLLAELIDSGEFTGKLGQTTVFYPRGALTAKRVIVIGLGALDQFSPEMLRRAIAVGMKKARDLKAVHVATVTAGTNKGNLSITESTQAIAEGALLGLYTYHGQKSNDAPDNTLESLTIVSDNESDAQAGINAGIAFAEGANLTRDLVNLPANICTPSYMAQRATEMAESVGLKAQVLEEGQMRALKMGALLAVAQGSKTPPRFIILEHNADKADDLPSVVLVGKGVTFDTGGYSIKTRDGMVGMKTDMGGGGAVIGAMLTVAKLDIPLHVVGLVPTADNMIDGGAYRPQDVITASNGKTIEIISTDAEGRMLLADALVYAKRYDPSAVVDIATLTGSCAVALGKASAGFFSTDDALTATLNSASDAKHERVWQLPLFDDYAKSLESETADFKNTGGRMGGVGSSAMFLKNFVEYPAWAHIDMAAMVKDLPDNPYMPTGASGYGARLLAEFTRQWAEK